jgi:hypothetical protein
MEKTGRQKTGRMEWQKDGYQEKMKDWKLGILEYSNDGKTSGRVHFYPFCAIFPI